MKFFVTHGQGLEPFVHKELENFENLFDIKIHNESNFHGKVIFSAEVKIPKSPLLEINASEKECGVLARYFISNLRTVERIFAFLFEEKHVSIVVGNERKNALSNLHSYISKIANVISHLLDDLYDFKVGNQNIQDKKTENSTDFKRQKKIRSFRVNAKVSGKCKYLLKPSSVAPCIGSALVKSFSLPSLTSWEIDLRNPTLELSVYLTDDGLLCGVALARHPLSERSYLNKIPLRSTIAYCMGSLAVEGETLEPGNLMIMDPMCGSSVILIELVKYFPQVLFAFGIDNDFSQVQEALQNIEKSDLSSRIFTILSDSTKTFSFRDNLLLDAVVCDLPFGIQHSCIRNGENILPLVLSNINSIVKVQGNIVLLISLQENLFVETTLTKQKLCWTLKKKYPVKLGELPATICHYKKML